MHHILTHRFTIFMSQHVTTLFLSHNKERCESIQSSVAFRFLYRIFRSMSVQMILMQKFIQLFQFPYFPLYSFAFILHPQFQFEPSPLFLLPHLYQSPHLIPLINKWNESLFSNQIINRMTFHLQTIQNYRFTNCLCMQIPIQQSTPPEKYTLILLHIYYFLSFHIYIIHFFN